MCQYCGCQAVEAIALLTAEHDEASTVVGQIVRALDHADTVTAAEAARQLARLLGPHTAVEEEGLFPALAQEFPDHVQRLAAEHRVIEEPLREAERSAGRAGPPGAGVPADPSWPQRLRTALHVLGEHILAEQDGVFPAALSNLGPQEWAQVDDVRRRAGSVLAGLPASGLT
jgi:hemerythrin-like domain-containing protein